MEMLEHGAIEVLEGTMFLCIGSGGENFYGTVLCWGGR